MENMTGEDLDNPQTPVRLGISNQKSNFRHADNYQAEMSGVELITEQVLAAEVLLIMELLGMEACADSYKVNME